MSPVHPATDDGSRPSPVTVSILDKDYRIACTEQEQHALMDCARLLDRRMREVRQNGRVIGADRIAVMAALNLIYELTQQRAEAAGPALPLDRLAALQGRVGAALSQTADAAPVPMSDLAPAPAGTPGRHATFEPAAEPAPEPTPAPTPAPTPGADSDAAASATGAKVALDGPGESV